MSDRDALIADLQATRAALTRQLDTIDQLAIGSGVSREQLMDPSGAFMAAPVLVALANVQCALLDATPVVDVARACDNESAPGHPGTYRCTRSEGHEGSHRTTGTGVVWNA